MTFLLAAGMAAAYATAGGTRTVPRPIVFPVVGPVTYTDDFGDPRGQGRHEGNDIMAPKGAIAVAAESGTVKFWVTSASAGCMLYLRGDSGTTYIYIHLNNDLTQENDNRGKCVAGTAYAPGLLDGQRVEAGDPVGFVGDSGDANGIHAHLHFEVHPGDGAATDPFPHLNRAMRLLFSAPRDSIVTMSLTGTVVTAGDGSVDVKVETAQLFPLGTRLTAPAKLLRLAVPITAVVDRGSLIGRKVIVLTAPATTSLATESATPGAFAVSRLVLRAG